MSENLKKQKQTQQKLMNSLIDLCDTKGYYHVTVDEICRHAGTYRSTFYRYFDSKDDLLREIEKKYVQDIRSLTPSIIFNFNPGNDFEMLKQNFLDELTQDMEYHYAHRQLYRFLLSPTGDPVFYKKLKESLTQIYKNHLRENGIHLSSNEAYIMNFFTDGYISTIQEWLKNDDCSPGEIALFLLKMIHTFSVAFHFSGTD